nr:hypothetical protein DWF04_18490 [Cereibacter sphaeroides f. sp. denitrificans]
MLLAGTRERRREVLPSVDACQHSSGVDGYSRHIMSGLSAKSLSRLFTYQARCSRSIATSMTPSTLSKYSCSLALMRARWA